MHQDEGDDQWSIKKNPWSWTKAASMLWVDQPAQAWCLVTHQFGTENDHVPYDSEW